MAVTFEQTANNKTGGSTTCAVTMSSTPTSGNLLVMVIATGSAHSISSISGETWTFVDGATNSAEVAIYTATSGGSNSSFTVTFGASEEAVVAVAEYSTDADSLALDQSNTNTGSGTSISGGSITPSSPTRLHVYGGATNGRVTFASYSTGFTERADDNNAASAGFMADKILPSAGPALNPQCSSSKTSSWAAAHATFEEVSSGINILRLRAQGY